MDIYYKYKTFIQPKISTGRRQTLKLSQKWTASVPRRNAYNCTINTIKTTKRVGLLRCRSTRDLQSNWSTSCSKFYNPIKFQHLNCSKFVIGKLYPGCGCWTTFSYKCFQFKTQLQRVTVFMLFIQSLKLYMYWCV